MATLLAWQPAQFAAKMGATSLVKEGASAAHRGIPRDMSATTAAHAEKEGKVTNEANLPPSLRK
jgi:hypothetical protein